MISASSSSSTPAPRQAGPTWRSNCFEVVPPLVALYPLDQPLNAMDGRHECASRFLPTARAVLHDDVSGPIIPRSGILLRTATPQSCSASPDRRPRIGPRIDGPPLPLNCRQTRCNRASVEGGERPILSVQVLGLRFQQRPGQGWLSSPGGDRSAIRRAACASNASPVLARTAGLPAASKPRRITPT